MENIVDTTKRILNEPKLGQIGLGDVILDEELIQMYFKVETLLPDLQQQIDQKIREKAIEEFYHQEDRYRCHGITPENLKMKEVWRTLDLEFKEGKVYSYIMICAVDMMTEDLEVGIKIPCDVSSIHDEIKSIVLKNIEKKYFGRMTYDK